MVTHIVIFSWIAGVSDVQVGMFGDALDTLASRIPDIDTIQHGSDLRFRGGNGDYALVVTFADRAAWDAYQAHPDHKAFLSEFVASMVSSRISLQF